jgi:hypothetical protein
LANEKQGPFGGVDSNAKLQFKCVSIYALGQFLFGYTFLRQKIIFTLKNFVGGKKSDLMVFYSTT